MYQVINRDGRENEFQIEAHEFPLDTFHIMSIPSSPVASDSNSSGFPSESGPTSVLEDIHDIQHDRAMRLYRPWSSPLRNEGNTNGSAGFSSASLSSPRSRNYHHQSPPNSKGHTSSVNGRNKHNKARQFRSQHRQEKLDSRRHQFFDKQVQQDFTSTQVTQMDQVVAGLDLDQLIEEERQADAEYEEEPEDYEEYIRDFENDLENYELQEELEIAELISNLDLGQK